MSTLSPPFKARVYQELAQKIVDNVRMRQSTDGIELKRLREQTEADAERHKKQNADYEALVDEHRQLKANMDNIKQDMSKLEVKLWAVKHIHHNVDHLFRLELSHRLATLEACDELLRF